MKQKVETAIELLAGKITDEVTPDDALKFTQAAWNLAQVLATKSVVDSQNR